MSEDNAISIGEAAEILGVSIQTLRRWDQDNKLKAIRTEGGQRRYSLETLKPFLSKDIFWETKIWALQEEVEPNEIFYCPTRPVFEARNSVMEKLLEKEVGEIYSLISTSAGEIGNNAYDHNLGKWPDIPGLYYSYELTKRKIVLADRGLGILKTLQQIIPSLKTHQEALNIAFTEVITGRAPERRGNGLKWVRRNVEHGYFSLTFQTGDAELTLKAGEKMTKDNIKKSDTNIQGCLAFLEF